MFNDLKNFSKTLIVQRFLMCMRPKVINDFGICMYIFGYTCYKKC